MAKPLIVGARVPQRWQQQINVITAASGRKEASVVREGLAQYLGKTDPGSVKGAMPFVGLLYALRPCNAFDHALRFRCATIASLEDRVANLERKLAGLGRLVSWVTQLPRKLCSGAQ